MIVPRARTEPSPAKTKMKVERNSAKVALTESGWVASSARPTAYRLGGMAAAAAAMAKTAQNEPPTLPFAQRIQPEAFEIRCF